MSEPQPAARRQLEFVKRQAGLVILVPAIALAAAAASSFTQQNVYRATTKIVVGQGGGIFQPQFGNVFQPFTQTMSSLFKSQIVANTVIQDLRLHETAKSLLGHVYVSSTPDSAVLEVNFDSSSRGAAVRILGRMASIFTSLVARKLGRSETTTTPQTGALPPITATVFDPAHASSTPVSPRPMRTLVFAGIIGLILGVILGLLRDALDDRLRSRDEIEELFARPVVATLPKALLGRQAVERAAAPVTALRREAAAQRRRLARVEAIDRLRLGLARNGASGMVYVITSSSAREGKSTVAANLGIGLALAGNDVICIDADPTKRRLSYYLDVEQSDLLGGLLDVNLRNGVVEESHIRALETDESDASQQQCREIRSNETDAAVESGRMQLVTYGDELEMRFHGSITNLTNALKSRAAYIIIDAPPVPSATTMALLSVADQTIVVAREKKTTKGQARSVRETLDRLQVQNCAIVSIGRE